MCKGILNVLDGTLEIHSTCLIRPDKNAKNKKMRQNSKDVLVAQDLYKSCMTYLSDVDILFAELPIGSQSSRACVSYGLCLGVVGALNNELSKVIEVTPAQVKKVVGNDNPSKEEMIDWALDMHPDINFPTYKKGKCLYISSAQAEHLADSLAAIYAGVKTPQFETLLNSIREKL